MNANPSASPYVNDLQNKVRVCRSNLLLAVAFTLINIVLLASKSTRYFLFSLVVPYRFVLNGMLFGGYMPDEFYVGEDGLTSYIEKNPSLLAMLGIVAAVILGLYMLFFFMSKKNVGWLVPTLVFVSLDCLAYVGLIFLYGFEISDILDLAFHAWLLYYMIAGVAAYVKLRKLPPEAFAPAPMPLENEPWPPAPMPEQTPEQTMAAAPIAADAAEASGEPEKAREAEEETETETGKETELVGH